MAEEKAKEVLELSVPTTLKNLIEALVFAAKEPLTIKQMRDIYEGEGLQSFLRQLDAEEIESSITDLNAEYEKGEKPYRIIRIAGGYQFATSTSYAEWIGRLYKEQSRRKLSQSGIESLAIIAYKQPVTKSDIESVRGVNCDYVLKTLLEKELVTVVGRAHAPGRPLLYGTTRDFLKHFGLNEITDLPRPREIEEILGESQFETERRMLEAQAGAEKMKEEEPDFKSRLPHIPKKKPDLDKTVEIKEKNSQREIRTFERTEIQATTGNEDRSVEQPLTHSVDETAAETEESPESIEDVDVSSDTTFADTSAEVRPEIIIPSETSNPLLVEQPAAEPVVDESPSKGSIPEFLVVRSGGSEMVVPTKTAAMPSVPQSIDQDLSYDKPAKEELSSPAQIKTKWQTWKEKVQGFIKKIFG